MDAAIKASLYLGTLALLGPGIYQHLVSFSVEHRHRWLVGAGFVLVVTASILHLVNTVVNVLGRFDAPFIWQYANTTQHGSMIFVRLALALVLLIVSLSPQWRGKAVVFGLASLGFLATFAALAHATIMRGNVGLITDLTHMTAATLWVSAVLFGAFTPITRAGLQRVSSLGLLSVVLLVGTGLYAGLLHINSISLLVGSSYGRILLLKLTLFTLVLCLAALNRWYFMPRLLERETRFRQILLTEAFLLVGVLLVTAMLTTTAPPNM
jgi:putative copper export protein